MAFGGKTHMGPSRLSGSTCKSQHPGFSCLFSPTRLAFGVLTIRIENRIVCASGGGSPATQAWFPRWSELGSPNEKIQKLWSQNDSKMIPKRFQNYPKIIPKWSQKDSKMIGKWFQNDPKMIPTWSENYPKMSPKWFQNNSKMIPKWSQTDPKMIPKLSQHDPKMTPTWSQNDPKMIPKWFQNYSKICLL